jgi:dTMP kinase
MRDKKGAFIVFEGIDGSGKTTQINLLDEHLKSKGYDTLTTKEPTNGLGRKIREVLRGDTTMTSDHLQALFSLDRAIHLMNDIEPALKQNKIVICDRYEWSTLAYGAASGADCAFLQEINDYFRKPDLTLLIDIDPDRANGRLKDRTTVKKEIFENLKSLRKIRAAYLDLSSKFGFKVIDGSGSVTEVNKSVVKAVDEFLSKRDEM